MREQGGATMRFVGLGLCAALATLCATQVARTGQPLYAVVIIFALPVLGSFRARRR
jgi:hypothetical protein